MTELRSETDRFHILVVRDDVAGEAMTDLVRDFREVLRDAPEKQMFLTDLRACEAIPPDAFSQLASALRMDDPKVRVHVLVAPEGTAVAEQVGALVADDDARRLVPDLDDARRVLVDHFGPAEDYAFEAYYAETRR